MKPVKVGICGLGTVGGGTFNVLLRNAELIAARVGRPVIVEQVGARSDNPACGTSTTSLTRDIFAVARNPDIDIVVESIGGYDVARTLILTAIEHGKHVVTANKALIAEYGNEIFQAAEEKGVIVAYEAAVAGGIPVIKSLREGLAGNQIHWLAGIINGTGNFILTEMGDHNRAFSDVLTEAQALGYAEADPAFDIEGTDACHKLVIMASIAFGIPLQFDKAYTEGISRVTPQDIQYAEALGYRIKHLGIARQTDRGVELRVHPTLLPVSQPLANINGVMNAVVIQGDAVGQTMYIGPGAGAEPTASSIIADIIDIARTLDAPRNAVKALGYAEDSINPALGILSITDIESSYYLRINAEDHPGVMTAVTCILGNHGINIDAITQKCTSSPAGYADIVILTHSVCEAEMDNAITELAALPDVHSDIMRIRVEPMG